MKTLHFPSLSARACLGLLLLFGTQAGAGAQTNAPTAPVQQVILVFKTHFDIGYTDMASNVVRRYRTTMIDQALQVCDQNRDLPPDQQFAWTIPGWPMKKILEDWDGQTAERKRRILEAFKNGRFVVHALPFTTHTELLEVEDLVRGLSFAARLSHSAGLPLPRDAKMTDVPCHSWIMPTLLKQAGVDFLHLGCNAASRSPQVPALFWWEGPDGSRLMTMYTAESYGTGLLPPKAWPYKTWLALIHTGDNHGPPNPDEVKKLLAEAKQKLPGVKVRIGRLSDFADAVVAENAKVPVVRGDMPDTWIHGPLSDPLGAKTARTTRPAIVTTELLDQHLRAWSVPAPEATAIVASAYERSLLYGEHTWGGALYWVNSYTAGNQYPYGERWKSERVQGRFNRLEASWDEHSAYIQTACNLITPVLNQHLQALAQAVKVEGRRIVVYNPLPWRRSGPVTVKVNGPSMSALKPVDSQQVVPAETSGADLRFIARDVPAMGYRTYVPAQAAVRPALLRADAQAGVLENSFFKLALDPARGTIRSLIDKRSGRQWVDTTARHGFGQFLHERFAANQVQAFVKAYVKIATAWSTNEFGKPDMPPAEQAPYQAISPRDFKLRVENSPVSATAILDAPPGAGLPYAVTSRFVLYRDLPWLDLEITLQEKPADPWPEAGWICLPFKVEQPQFRLGRLGSIIDPAKDIIPGANHHLFGLNSGLTIADTAGHGVGVCPIDQPLVSLGTPGCWQYSADFLPRKPAVYVNLFNNQWTTNFRLWNQGSWTSRVRLWSLRRPDAESALATPSAEARFPLLAVEARDAAGKLPATQPGLELSRRGVLVTAFGANPYGHGTLLRLWEQAGQSGNCRVRLPAGRKARQAQPVNLRGQLTGEPIPIKQGTFVAPIHAFAPVTFVIKTD